MASKRETLNSNQEQGASIQPKCKYCKKDVSNYLQFSPLFCPFCGAVVDDKNAGDRAKERNILTGRAPWKQKWSILIPIMSILVMTGVTLLVLITVITVIVSNNPDLITSPEELETLIMDILNQPYTTALLSVVEISLIIFPLVFLKKYYKSVKDRFLLLGWRPYFFHPRGNAPLDGLKKLGRELGIGFVLAFALLGVAICVEFLNGLMWNSIIEIPDDMNLGISPNTLPEMIALVASMLLIVGPTEELLFRGYTQQGLEDRQGAVKAIVITALLFTAVHVMPSFIPTPLTLYLFLPYFTISIFISYIYHLTGNLNIMIFMHGIYDSILVVGLFLEGKGAFVASDVISYGGLFAALGIMIFLVASHVYPSCERKPAPLV
ncbi:CPBP family intramembrane metalloprotease [Candidatus Bathyarchaeota archaeon]|nr:CPBP family intramembrane metalloprotease [Candidatus Bathyarchaeota archaeon]